MTVTLRLPTVTVPRLSALPVFRVAVTVTVPLPATVEGVTDSQLRLSRTEYRHDAGAYTVSVPLPPPAGNVSGFGVTAGDGGHPPWRTVNVWPMTVTVALRRLVPVFPAAV
ncbi:MAG: hypothetical protein OXE75_17790 [bacterium]|nr:hypothetical protein [bacterium]